MTENVKRPARVLIVDDSRTIRAMLRTIIGTDPRLEVVGEATDPYAARDAIKQLSPDVITLDVEMPRMNGLVFLEHLMRLRPTPTIMVSTRAQENSDVAIKALSLGAIDCIDLKRFMGNPEMFSGLIETLLTAASARVRGPVRVETSTPTKASPNFSWNNKIVLIGSSTGGVDALGQILSRFPEDCPPTLIAQHMPPAFLESFSRRLDATIAPRVQVLNERTPIRQGEVFFAAGGELHLELRQGVPGPCAVPRKDGGGSLYVPAVDVLFRSAVPLARRCIGVILTGMGRDGADGLKALRDAGARTLGQTANSCVVDGMPRAARDCGAVEQSVPLSKMGATILQQAGRDARTDAGERAL